MRLSYGSDSGDSTRGGGGGGVKRTRRRSRWSTSSLAGCLAGFSCSLLILARLLGLTPSLPGSTLERRTARGHPTDRLGSEPGEAEVSADATVRYDEDYELAAATALTARRAARQVRQPRRLCATSPGVFCLNPRT